MNKLLIFVLFSLLFSWTAAAQTVAPFDTPARQAFLMDANTGTVLYEKDQDTQMPTSSMSKMMTMYLVFEAIKNEKIHWDTLLPVSEHAWKQEGSRMFLNVGQNVKVEDLVRGVIVQSGNDAAVTFAEALGSGSESSFAEAMNLKAKELGLSNSHFMNATGLPDPQHYSTARDLATLALALLHDFPEDYHFFSEPEFTYNGIKQGNRNPLLYRNMNVDGLKTGHTDIGGFGLTASAVRDNRRLILVLNGLSDMQARADESARLLDWGYREYGLYNVVHKHDRLAEATVWLGQTATVPLVVDQDVNITLPRSARAQLKATLQFTQPVKAPVLQGQKIGKLLVTAPGMESKEFDLIAGTDVPVIGLFSRIAERMHYLLNK